MAGERRYEPEPDVVPAAEATVARAEADEMMGGPGMVATPGMWRGWVRGGVTGTLIGAVVAAVIGAIVVATSSASAWWIVGAAVIGGFAGGTIGFVLGASFATLKYDQGDRRPEEDDGGPIHRTPDAHAGRVTHRAPRGSGSMGTTH
jgi:hypothetical protein